jgi:hypothetical protein
MLWLNVIRLAEAKARWTKAGRYAATRAGDEARET